MTTGIACPDGEIGVLAAFQAGKGSMAGYFNGSFLYDELSSKGFRFKPYKD